MLTEDKADFGYGPGKGYRGDGQDRIVPGHRGCLEHSGHGKPLSGYGHDKRIDAERGAAQDNAVKVLALCTFPKGDISCRLRIGHDIDIHPGTVRTQGVEHSRTQGHSETGDGRMRHTGIRQLGTGEGLVTHKLPVIRAATVDENPELQGADHLLIVQGTHAAGFALGGPHVGDVNAHRQFRRILNHVGTLATGEGPCRQ